MTDDIDDLVESDIGFLDLLIGIVKPNHVTDKARQSEDLDGSED